MLQYNITIKTIQICSVGCLFPSALIGVILIDNFRLSPLFDVNAEFIFKDGTVQKWIILPMLVATHVYPEIMV
jgi:hypothetical protein